MSTGMTVRRRREACGRQEGGVCRPWRAASENHMGNAAAQGPDASYEAGIGRVEGGAAGVEELGKMFQS